MLATLRKNPRGSALPLALSVLLAIVAAVISAPPVRGSSPATKPASPSTAESGWTREDAAHLLRHAGFGGTPQQIDRLFSLGRTAAVDYLLTGQLPPRAQAPFDHAALSDFKFTAPDPAEQKADTQKKTARKNNAKPAPNINASDVKPAAATLPAEKKKKLNKKAQIRRQEIGELRDWWIDRMVRTDQPLPEKMTLFWHGLFTSGVQEVKDAGMMARQNALFHAHAMGDYQQLADDIIHDPAMLRYLNANENVKGKPNENLAREFMELFTMGEGQGYTEKDIGQVARALTGLAPGKTGVVLRPQLHDSGEKTIFGHSGNFGPDDVVKQVFAQPEPADYLARKLWEFFAYPDPSPQDIQPIADALRTNHYQVAPALRLLFNSPAFYSEKAKFALIKSPTQLIVESMRELGISSDPKSLNNIVRQMKTMGQELLQPPNVKGWPGGEHWITSSTLFTRYNVVCAMINGAIHVNAKGDLRPNARPSYSISPTQLFPNLPAHPQPGALVDAAIARFLQRPLDPSKRDVLVKSLGDQPLQLGQPQSDQRILVMLSLLLSTPEYQVN